MDRWTRDDPRQRVGDQTLLHSPHAAATESADQCSDSGKGDDSVFRTSFTTS